MAARKVRKSTAAPKVRNGTAGSKARNGTPDFLTKSEMYRILEQATLILSEFYVHLPQKRARYAYDPLQALRLLEARVESLEEGKADEFHGEMFSIFNRLKDNHTLYEVGDRDRRMACLPFSVRRSDDQKKPRYWVTHLNRRTSACPHAQKEGVRCRS